MPSAIAAKRVAEKLSGEITRKRPSWKPKMWISTRPITKLGTDRNNEGKPRSKPWPNRLGTNWVPKAIATASSSATAKPADARTSVEGRTSAIRVVTGRLDRIDRPRSPVTKWDKDVHSWTRIGWSNPWAAMISLISSSVNPFWGSRRTLVMGSPGRMLTTTKVKT